MHIVDYPDRPFIDTSRQTGKSDLAKRILEYSRNRMDKYQRELTRKNRYFYAMMNEMKLCGSGRNAIKMKRFRKFRRYLERQLGVNSIMYTGKKPYKHYIFDDSITKMYPNTMKAIEL